MSATVRYEWDPEKSRANKRKHGLTFEAMNAFDWTFARLDRVQFIDGEEREAHIGPIGEALYVVIATQRGEALRVISLRRATNAEISRWKEEFYDPPPAAAH